jgi:toxin-antitoxin system PIN domain toxin
LLVVDTNIFVHATDADSPFHSACEAWLDRQRGLPDAWYTTWPIVYEFMRIATHRKVLRRPWPASAAWSVVQALLDSPGLRVLTATEQHAAVAAQVLAELPFLAGSIFHDAHTAILMREHGIRRIVTRDTDFYRFPFLEPFDPVA